MQQDQVGRGDLGLLALHVLGVAAGAERVLLLAREVELAGIGALAGEIVRPERRFQPSAYRSLTTTSCPSAEKVSTAASLSAPLKDAGSGCAKTTRTFT